MSSREKQDYEFTPYDGTPGKAWDDFLVRLRNHAAGDVDDRGWSVADHLADVDEGGAGVGAPGMPAAATELRKAQANRRRRQKKLYNLFVRHLTHEGHITHITTNRRR